MPLCCACTLVATVARIRTIQFTAPLPWSHDRIEHNLPVERKPGAHRTHSQHYTPSGLYSRATAPTYPQVQAPAEHPHSEPMRVHCASTQAPGRSWTDPQAAGAARASPVSTSTTAMLSIFQRGSATSAPSLSSRSHSPRDSARVRSRRSCATARNSIHLSPAEGARCPHLCPTKLVLLSSSTSSESASGASAWWKHGMRSASRHVKCSTSFFTCHRYDACPAVASALRNPCSHALSQRAAATVSASGAANTLSRRWEAAARVCESVWACSQCLCGVDDLRGACGGACGACCGACGACCDARCALALELL